jgi:hypothetical protein
MQIINKLLRLQKVYIFFTSLVLFIIFISSTYLYANTFKVSDIEISSPFELNFKKNRVIDKGFQVSFFNLLTMITTSGERDKIKNISIKELKGMIDSFTISDENFIDNKYFAKLETTFNKKKILNFLEKKNIFPSMPIRNKVLLIPILVDIETDNIYLFNNNVFYKRWNDNKKNYQLIDYLLPSEDIEDLNKIQEMSKTIDNYDFLSLVKKYDISDYIISIIYKDINEIKILSKINMNDSLKIDNQKYENINLEEKKDFQLVLENLKTIYEDSWKKSNEINTSIKLPLTISIDSKNHEKIQRLEETLNNMVLISEFFILKFDNKSIHYKIIFNGSPRTFLNNMKKNNFEFSLENEAWIVR